MEHTQGEWHTETTPDGDLYVVPPAGGLRGRYYIGNITLTNTQHLPGHARLFANAERLLAACEASLALYNEQLRILRGCGFEEAAIECEVGKKLRAAIAAVRGEEE